MYKMYLRNRDCDLLPDILCLNYEQYPFLSGLVTYRMLQTTCLAQAYTMLSKYIKILCIQISPDLKTE